VATSITAFFGRAINGPVNKAIRIQAFSEFEKIFGPADPLSELFTSVRLFFQNGGTDCYVVRLVGVNEDGSLSGNRASITLENEHKDAVLIFTAKEIGTQGNDLALEVDYNTAMPEDTYHLRVYRMDRDGSILDKEEFLNCSADSNDPGFPPTIVKQTSKLVDCDPVSGYSTLNNSSSGTSISQRPFDNWTEFYNLITDTQKAFQISIDGSSFYEVNLKSTFTQAPTAWNNLETMIKAAIDSSVDASHRGAVKVSFKDGPSNKKLLQFASDTQDIRKSINIRQGSSNDIAKVLMLGVEHGGIESSRFSSLRPAPTGIFFDVKEESLNSLANTHQNYFNAITISSDSGDGVNIEFRKNELQTTNANDPWYKSAGDPGFDGIREKFAVISNAINSVGGWTASLAGSRLLVKKKFSRANSNYSLYTNNSLNTPMASLTLSPDTGLAATSITVNGKNFTANSIITLKVGTTPITPTDPAPTTPPTPLRSNGNGEFTAKFNLPSTNAAGLQTITASDSDPSTPKTAIAAFIVVESATGPTLTLSPNRGYAATSITVNGKNFTANSIITLKVGTTPITPTDPAPTTPPTTLRSNGNGEFTAKFNLPITNAAGLQTITASDDATTPKTAIAAFIVNTGDISAFFKSNVAYYLLGSKFGDYVKEASGGIEGNPPNLKSYLGSQNDHTGLYALDLVDLFNLMVIPPDKNLRDDDYMAIWPLASNYCKQHRAFLIIDPPSNWTGYRDVLDASKGIRSLRIGTAKDYAAVYFPRLIISEGKVKRTVAPSGAIAGLYSRIDSSGGGGIWKAPAGTSADIQAISNLEVILTDSENGALNKEAVNCLRRFPDGIVSWGARTMDGADDFGSEWKYIPIRRLALMIEESLYRGTKWVVFEPNDEPLWAKIRLNVGAFMMGLFRQGAFQGSSPDKAFFVKCDATTTTQADRNLGIVNILVGFAPLKPAEFVIIQIQQMAGDLI